MVSPDRVQDETSPLPPNPTQTQNQQQNDDLQYGTGFRGWMKKKMTQLGNNIDLITLYARQKDFYKVFELIGPWLGAAIPWKLVSGDKPKDSLKKQSDAIDQARIDMLEAHKSGDLSAWRDAATRVEQGIYDYRSGREKVEYNYKLNRLNKNLIGDTMNFFLQAGISGFSSWWEKNSVIRTYEKLVKEELNISGPLTFEDMKRSKNPIVQEATEYYSKKGLYRFLPDLAGLVRWIPRLYFGHKLGKYGKEEWGNKDIRPRSKLDKTMWNIAENIDGIKLLLGLKTAFFSWYFMARQKGSFYIAQDIWDKTEGDILANRDVNKHKLSNEFVSQQEITRLYDAYQKENPELKLPKFTTDDPLSNRLFEQVSRYVNHTYKRKLFATNEPDKQWDLEGNSHNKKLSHAMLIEYVGNGGLRVNDALGSALKLEVMAYYGGHGVGKDDVNLTEAIRQFRKVTEEIEKLPHPYPDNYGNLKDTGELNRAVKDVHDYFAGLEKIGKKYLGDDWPPKYIYEELKPNFVQYFFQKTLSTEHLLYMGNALATIPEGSVPEEYFKKYENAPYPASVLANTAAYRRVGGNYSLHPNEKGHVMQKDEKTSLEEELLLPDHDAPVEKDSGKTAGTEKPAHHANSEVNFKDKPVGIRINENAEISTDAQNHQGKVIRKDHSAVQPRSLKDYASKTEETELAAAL